MLPCPNNTNGILLPQLSPLPVFSLDNDETLLHYDPQDLLSQYCLLQESLIIDHDDNKQHTAAGRTTTTTTSYAMEKNNGRHSKIFTATGPRDRRVRLSKDIARKFFDLQDLLGFDRASKTLDWLMTKSKPAIKDLIKPIISSRMYSTTLCCSPSSSSASECENLEESKKMNNNNNKQKKQKRRINPSSEKKRKPGDDRIIMMAKEMRAKARERARERTKDKLFLREVMNYGYSFTSCLQAPNNLILSRESSSNFSHRSPNTATRQENWDISSVVTSSSSTCFHPLNSMISTSSSSPVLQIRRNPFDLAEYNNSNNNHGLMW